MAELHTWHGLLPDVIEEVMEHFGLDWDDSKLNVSASHPSGYGNTEWWVLISEDEVSIMYALNAHKYEDVHKKIDDYFKERDEVMTEAYREYEEGE